MRMYDIIHKKRDGAELNRAELEFFIASLLSEDIPDYQTSALLMAIFFRGMTERETTELTDIMARSGNMLDLSELGNLSADKHSSGGVGDKTSLIAAPAAACLGVKVAKMSGRGLGHTGGTVDKLEAIPGYRSSLEISEFIQQVKKIGIAVIGQTGELAAADKKLYAIRDLTCTVDSIPLITSSIMSKKLAAGTKNIVLDVKYGSGAFMKTPEEAEMLADEMVRIGKSCGRRMAALITDMDTPLGSNIGNALEIIEAVDVLRGNVYNDLRELSLALAANMAALALEIDTEKAFSMVEQAVDSGRAFEKFKEWIACQGGELAFIDGSKQFPPAKFVHEIKSGSDGYIYSMNAELIGGACLALGAGRAVKDDIIDSAAGIILNKKTGDFVKKGDLLCTLYTNRAESLKDAAALCSSALRFSEKKPPERPLIYKLIR